MALTKPHVDTSTGAEYPEAYWRVVEVSLKPRLNAAVVTVQMYASQAARRDGKQPIPGAVEVWARNTVDTVRVEVERPEQEGELPPTPPEGVLVDTAGWYRMEQVPRNDYDEWFGPATLAREGVDTIGQAYRLVKAQPEWAGAKDA